MALDPASLIGRRFGPVQVLAPLGQGGMGTVFRARDAAGREVALKLALDPVQRTSSQARFQREGEIAASLDHPGLVRVHAAGTEAGVPYMVCELVEGGQPLDQACAGQPLEARARLVAQAARALGHAHRRGVTHRDLKPSNILVDARGEVKVIDFGVAYDPRYAERLTATGIAVGTPGYMSPEHLRGKRGTVTPMCDVWSLGVVLYELLTGCMPFSGDSVMDLLQAITKGAVIPPRQLEPAVSADLEAVCLQALSRDVEDRYADGEAFAADLERALGGEPPLARGPRTRLVLAGAGLGAFLVASAGLFLLRPIGDAPPAAAEPTPPPTSPASPDGAETTVAARALRALERGDAGEALAALKPCPDLRAEDGLDAVRQGARRLGETLLAPADAGPAELEPVFRLGEVLRRALGTCEAEAFELAVVARAEAFAAATERKLEDERTVLLLEGLARMGVVLPDERVHQLIVGLLVGFRPTSRWFARRCHRVAVALLRMHALLDSEFFQWSGGRQWLGPYPKTGDPLVRYAWLRAELASLAREEAPPEHRVQPLFAALREVVDAMRPEDVGERPFANALAGLAEAQAYLDQTVDADLYPRALELFPRDPAYLAGDADQRLREAGRLLKRGEVPPALERTQEARESARLAEQECQQRGYSSAAHTQLRKEIRRSRVTCAGLLGDRAEAQRLIEAVPAEAWLRERELGELQATLLEALEIREQVIRPGGVGSR